MRITIELDGATLQQAGFVKQEHREPVPEPQPQPEPQPEQKLEDIDAGPPPAELLETLAMEGALAPFMSSFQPLPGSDALSAGGPPHSPVRATWQGGTLMRKRRD